MDDLDILSSALIEIKKKIDDQNKIIEKLNLEKLDLIEKYNYILEKVNDINLKQKDNEKYNNQLNKEIEKYKKILDDVENLVEEKFENLIKKFDAEKIKEKIKELEEIKNTEKKISDIINFEKSLEKRIQENQKLISDFKKEIDVLLKQEDKKQKNFVFEKTDEYFDKVTQNLNDIKKEIKDQKNQINEIIKDQDKFKQLNSSRFEAILKSNTTFNQIMKKYEEYIIDLEKRTDDKLKNLERSLKSYNDEIRKVLLNQEKETDELKSFIEKTKNDLSDLENQIKQEKDLHNQHINKVKVELDDKIKNYISDIKKDILNELWKEKKEISINLEKIKNLEKEQINIQKEYRRLNEDLINFENKFLEEARKISRKEIEKHTQEIQNQNNIINQKIRQIETSFNVIVKNSNNFYDITKKDINYIRDFTLSLDNSIKNEIQKRLFLQEKLEDLNLDFRRLIDNNDNLKANLDDKMKKLIDHIDMLEKSISLNQKELFSYVNNENQKYKDYTDKNVKELIKKIDEINKDRKTKEDYRIEKINNIIKELNEKKSSLEVKIDVLSSYINKFNEMKNSFRKEILLDVKNIVKDVENRQKYHHDKIIINDNDIKDIEKRMDKMEKMILELSKQVEIWKEKYKLQLGRIAQEVDFE